MDRGQKEELVASLHQVFEDAAMVVVTHYAGLTVSEMGDLRDRMRAEGAGFTVTKNRLTRLALQGTRFQDLNDLFTGPTAIAYSRDPVAAARVAVDFAKDNDSLVVLGGALGAERLDVDRVKALAALPSLDEIRARFVGLIRAPATKVAGVLQAPAGRVARVLGAYAGQGESA